MLDKGPIFELLRFTVELEPYPRRWWQRRARKRINEYLVARSDCKSFVDATIELHHDRGINPHSHNKAFRLVSIHVSRLQPTGPFWWSTPGLPDESGHNGATIWEWEREATLMWPLAESSDTTPLNES